MRLSGTDLRLLKVFDAAVRHDGFAAAQTELNVGLSTISNHITALEQRLGVKLCQRGRSGFKLSTEGELVFEEAQRLPLRANKRETIDWLKFTLEGVGERTHGYAFTITTFARCWIWSRFGPDVASPRC
jgi:DNA-binding transcriptional LysR family regulator